MAEWSKAHAWKVCIGQKPIVGSNPTRSAKHPQHLSPIAGTHGKGAEQASLRQPIRHWPLGESRFRERLAEIAGERERERERREEERRRHLAALEAKRIEDLKASGVLLRHAGELRVLVAQVKAAVLAGELAADPADLARWERWALAQADRLDPVLSGQVLSHLRVAELDE